MLPMTDETWTEAYIPCSCRLAAGMELVKVLPSGLLLFNSVMKGATLNHTLLSGMPKAK